MHCVGCVWVLEQLSRLMPGVSEARVSFADGTISIRYDAEKVKLSSAVELLGSLGYLARPYTSAERSQRERDEQREFLFRLGVAGFGAGNTMVIATSLYQGFLSGIDPSVRDFLHWISMIIAFPVVLVAGRPFLRSFVSSVLARRLHMDVPIGIGIITILSYSIWNTFVGADRVYFDSLCALLFLLLLGRYFQFRALTHARQAQRSGLELLPLSAEVIRAGTTQQVPQWDIRASDVVVVPPAARVPIDGTVLSGLSRYNTAVMTGESTPEALGPGASVFAGYLNLEARVEIEPSASPDGTRLSKLMRILEEGATRKTPLVESAERILGWFIVIILLLAAGTFAWWSTVSIQAALDATVSLLVICCPCALALATPLALATGVRRAGGRGMLIRSAEVFERLRQVHTVFLDKTGTITVGLLEARGPYSHSALSASQLQYALLLANFGVSHPASRAIQALLCSRGVTVPPEIEDSLKESSRLVVGSGVRAVDADGHEWRLGSERFALLSAELNRQEAPFALPQGTSANTDIVTSRIFFSCDGAKVAEFILSDALQPHAKQVVQDLKRRGIIVGILSGDHSDVVAATGAALGLKSEDCHGGLSPEAKQLRVEAAGPGTVMVGDGVNDAGALAAADVGVAVQGDALRCLESSDVALVQPDLKALPELLDGAHRVIRVVRENLAISLAYNVVGAYLAVTGQVDPLIAAIVMPLSSLTVLANSHFRAMFSASPVTHGVR
jgi:Cu2+-exporting ATPase